MPKKPDVNELLDDLRQRASACEDLAVKKSLEAAAQAKKKGEEARLMQGICKKEAERLREKKTVYEHAANLTEEWARRFGLPVRISPQDPHV